jgi:hypothetical protein
VSTERSSSTRCDNSRPLERERKFECALTLVACSDEHQLWLDRDEPFMSQKTVQFFIGRVLTDEDLRQQFLADPRGMLTTFRDQGFELTSGEIESLIQTEKALWTEAAERIHPRLQRCSFHGK